MKFLWPHSSYPARQGNQIVLSPPPQYRPVLLGGLRGGLIGDGYAIITKSVCLSVLTLLFTELIAL